MIIDIFPGWLLFFLTAGLVLLAIEVGFRFGRSVSRKVKDEQESTASAIAGAILGLQAFILAFTFSIVSDRYDAKKALVREEANAIRTVWHRADLLQEPGRAKSKAILREYVDKRIALAASGDLQFVEASLGDSLQMQRELWEIAVANGRLDLNSDIGALYIESVNEIAALHAMRVSIGLQARIPGGIWGAHFALLILGMIGFGYHSAIAGSRRSRGTPILAIAFSLVVLLNAALDHPGPGLFPVSQLPLVNVQSEMAAESGTAK